jgi:hypothetical protein
MEYRALSQGQRRGVLETVSFDRQSYFNVLDRRDKQSQSRCE